MVLKICCKTLQGNKDVADSQANLVPNPPVSTDFSIPTESINKMSWDKKPARDFTRGRSSKMGLFLRADTEFIPAKLTTGLGGRGGVCVSLEGWRSLLTL